MELKQLIAFSTVAETKSMKMASMRCNISISAISKQIKTLEEELGVELFDRRKTDVTLTEDGADFLNTARMMIKSATDFKEKVASKKGELCGELRLGVGQFIAPYIRKVAVEFMKRYPKVRLNVHFDNAQMLNKMLRLGELDVAFTMNQAYHNEGILSKPCIPFMLSAIMSKQNSLAVKKSVNFDDLMESKIIMPDVGERVFQTFQKYTTFDISKLPILAIVSNASEALIVLDELDAITFLPSHYIITSQKLVAKPIDTIDMELMSNAHWLKETPIKASAKAFLDIIDEMRK